MSNSMAEFHETETCSGSSAKVSLLAPLLAPGTLVAGRYEVLSACGAGGWAVVYATHDRVLNRKVALKLLRAERATEVSIKRLRREVALARQVDASHAVRVFDIGESEFGFFVTMELVEGETLRDRIARERLSIPEAVAMAEAVLEALAALHSIGLIHRDVKPSNVLLDASGNLKLADFGLARHFELAESSTTETDGLLGTVEYLSPEQALGRDLDPRTDLYSFGLMMYEALTGELPFTGLTRIATIVARLNGPPGPIRRLRHDVPRWLARFIMRLLERDPCHRYLSAEAALHDLQRRRVVVKLRLPAVAAVATLLLAAGTWSAFRGAPRPRFAAVVQDGDHSVRAVATDGATLWRRPLFSADVRSAVVRRRGRAPLIAIIGATQSGLDDAARSKLVLLDSDNGRVVEQVRISDGAVYFSDFSRTYSMERVTSLDLDGDGNDEVLATFCHVPYWPSYTVWFNPVTGESRIIFVGSGHHRVVGAVDVNGDGRRDVIMAGINNRMGWYAAVAAVDVPQTVSGGGSVRRLAPVAFSPDSSYASSNEHQLLWYTLLPPGHPSPDNTWVNLATRTIDVRGPEGQTVRVGFDGAILDSRPRIRGPERQIHQQRAYAELREAARLIAGGFSGEALAACSRARASAERADDRFLTEWIDRVKGKALVADGQYAAAEAHFERLMSSDSATDIVWEAAVPLHLAGRLAAAARWYERGLGAGANESRGRLRYEFVEGEILALCELGDFARARSVLARYEAAFQDGIRLSAIYENYISWRAGEPLQAYKPLNDADAPDLLRYWDLEFRLVRGEDPGVVLRDLDRQLGRQSGSGVMLRSLQAVILKRLGRSAEAAAVARLAYETALVESRRDTGVRAHLSLITARYREICGSAVQRPKAFM